MRNFQGAINTIQVFGDRIFITDMSDSFHIVKYRKHDNQFFEFADDILPRWITSCCVLDYHTICGADKFENVFVCRIPQDIDDELEDNPITYQFRWETGLMNGAPYKVRIKFDEIYLNR